MAQVAGSGTAPATDAANVPLTALVIVTEPRSVPNVAAIPRQ